MTPRSSRFVSLITRDTVALVLAGGRGTRLGALTSDRVKPAVPFGGKYRMIDFPLSNCINSGIRRIGVLTQYKSHSLIRHLQMGWSFLRNELNEFVEVLPAQQRTGAGWYEGTADAVYQNLDIITAHQSEYVLILGGDHIYKMDYGMMLGQHVERRADITVGCVEVSLDEAREFGVMSVADDGAVYEFNEKPKIPTSIPGRHDQALASMGIYIFKTSYLVRMLNADARKSGSERDFGKDILPAAVAAGDRVFAFAFRDPDGNRQGYWRDVGNVDAYWRANLELTQVLPPLDVYDRSWPIWTYQEQSPPAKFVFDDPGRRGYAVDSMVSGGSIISGASLRGSLLFPFVRVDEGATLDEVVVLPNAHIGAGARIRRAVIETGCHIPPGMAIGYDPDFDGERFEISAGGVTVVTPEMLGQKISYVR